ncbi:MAG TPA: DUF4386 domain-containing protein [Pyrinomonadaceae bacterium]|nr:DUF4386 domain-containing protein [Pyrinomonadaceae bacterium]
MTYPRRLARIIGLLFLLTILAGVFAQAFVSERLIVFSDAAATANNILTHRGLYQLGFSVYLIEMACQIATAALWYVLLRPVNRSVALTAAFMELAGCVVKIGARVFYLAPLFVLGAGGTSALHGFSAEQLPAIALILLKVNDYGAATALAFFGFSTPLNGYLIFRSKFLPRWLGVISMIAGLGWLTFLYPPFGYRAFPFIALLGLIGSAATIFWLLVFGVDEEKWKTRAAE